MNFTFHLDVQHEESTKIPTLRVVLLLTMNWKAHYEVNKKRGIKKSGPLREVIKNRNIQDFQKQKL
jgi:hypothetical protein